MSRSGSAETLEHVLDETDQPPSADQLYRVLGDEVAAVLSTAQRAASAMQEQAETEARDLQATAARLAEETIAEANRIHQTAQEFAARVEREHEALLGEVRLREEAVAQPRMTIRQTAPKTTTDSLVKLNRSDRPDRPDRPDRSDLGDQAHPATNRPSGEGT